MIDPETIRQLALSLPETDEAPHHEITSFRVKKKIFASLNIPKARATLHFTLENQDIFSSFSQGSIFPVPNKWGKFGWTTVELSTVHPELLKDAILVAWRDTAPPSFLKKYPESYVDQE